MTWSFGKRVYALKRKSGYPTTLNFQKNTESFSTVITESFSNFVNFQQITLGFLMPLKNSPA